MIIENLLPHFVHIFCTSDNRKNYGIIVRKKQIICHAIYLTN
jgi:hypothetical protein